MTPTDHSTFETSVVTTAPPVREFSGKLLLLSIVLLALVMSSGLSLYWHLHTRPFAPLQRAVAAAFPKSGPQVQGGQRKMHKGTPKILRITLKVKFNPELTESDEQVQAMVNQLESLAKQHIDFLSYDEFEVHLVQMQPEHAAKKRTIVRDIARAC